jgi:hypothetical protein
LFRERRKVSKRNLRVAIWIGQVPAIGVCTFCNREFKVPLTAMNRVADAQESLRLQFTEHKCEGETGSPDASFGTEKPCLSTQVVRPSILEDSEF